MWYQPTSIPWHSKILQLAVAGARVWRRKEVAGIRDSSEQAVGQPRSTRMLGNEAVCAKMDRGELDRDAFAAIRLKSPFLCCPGDNS